MPELVATLKAMYESENRKNKFLAMVNGIEMDQSSDKQDDEESRPVTFQEIQARATAKLTGDTTQAKAIEYGFTPDMGMAYEIVGDIDGRH